MKDTVFDFIRRMTGGNKEVAELCAATVDVLKEGNVCLALDEAQRALLETEPAVASFVERDADPASVRTPFVVAGGMLYTRRDWVYERRVRDWILSRAGAQAAGASALPDDPFYAGLRPEQRQAVLAMAGARFSILTGGPGTGKTFTISRAVQFVRDQCPDLRLGLAAPTGKAAARMMDSMRESLQGQQADVPPATTLHSMLKPNYDLVTFKHGRDNPLPFDWLVVDEASMVDLPLMAKLLDAVPETCRLTLVGDADQLASVERGRVFGDLCRFPGVAVSRLAESSRFPADGDIAKLAAAVNGARADEALALLKGGSATLSYGDLSSVDSFDPETWPGFAKAVASGFQRFAESAKADEEGRTRAETALDRLNDFRVLCALRRGPFGAERISEWIKRKLGRSCPTPLMITRNDRLLNVSNGDVGVVLPDEPDRIHLPAKEGIRSIRLELLPETELAFASTVHKAQGSDYGDVAIVLPPDSGAESGGSDETAETTEKLLTREILYTAVTRTKGRAFLWASDASVRHCAEHAIERVSGLL